MEATGAFKNLQLITGGDPALDIELLEAFLITSHEYIGNMQRADKMNDPVAWHNEAHAMKGGCFNLGADYLGKLCQTAELQAHSPSDKREEILQTVKKEFAMLEITILEMIKERKAQINAG